MPPVWLALALALAWALGRLAPGPGFGVWADWAGPPLVLAGLILTGLAAWGFVKARTSIVPGEAPSALIDTGIFRYTRNPIYLGDVLILAGGILYWDAVLALPLLPAFAWLLQRRFILPEEGRLRDAFGPAFEAWAARTRRWI